MTRAEVKEVLAETFSLDGKKTFQEWCNYLQPKFPLVVKWYKKHASTDTVNLYFYGFGSSSFIGSVIWRGTLEIESLSRNYESHFREADTVKGLQALEDFLQANWKEVKPFSFPCSLEEAMAELKRINPALHAEVARCGQKINPDIYRSWTEETPFLRRSFMWSMSSQEYSFWNAVFNQAETCGIESVTPEFIQSLKAGKTVVIDSVRERKTNTEVRQYMMICNNIAEVKDCLKHVGQSDKFSHSERLVLFYDLDLQQIFHVGSTKKSHWKQVPNKSHKLISVSEFKSMVKATVDAPKVTQSKKSEVYDSLSW